MLYKFQNDWNKNSKYLLAKSRYKMCKWKETKNLITAKTVQYRILKAKESNVNDYEKKTKVQTTIDYKVMHRLEQIPKGVV